MNRPAKLIILIITIIVIVSTPILYLMGIISLWMQMVILVFVLILQRVCYNIINRQQRKRHGGIWN